MPAASRVAAARAQPRGRARIPGDACARVVCLCSLLLVGLLRAVGAQQPEQQQRAVQRQLLRRPELERQRELQEQAQPQLVTVVGKLHKAGSVLISDFFGGPVRRQRLADVEFVKYLSIRRPGCAREFFSRGERCPPGSWLDVACNYTVERALAPPEPSERVRPTALTMAGDSVAAGRSRPPKALVLLMNNAVEHDWETTPYESLPPECKAMAAAGAYRYISGMRDPFSAAVSDYLYTKADKEPHWMEKPRPDEGNRSITQVLNEMSVAEGLEHNMERGAIKGALLHYVRNYRNSGAAEMGAPHMPLRIERFETYPGAFDAFEEVLHFATFGVADAAMVRAIAARTAREQVSSTGGFSSAHSTNSQAHAGSDERQAMVRILHDHPVHGPRLCEAQVQLEYAVGPARYPCLEFERE